MPERPEGMEWPPPPEQNEPKVGSESSDLLGLLKKCGWPESLEFTFYDEPGEHDPCYVVMPGGCSLPLNHCATVEMDISRAQFIIDACNEKLRQIRLMNAEICATKRALGYDA